MVRVAGGTHAALPSAHNFIIMLLCGSAMRWKPRLRWLWISIIVILALSTLFTGQHYILDVVAGLLLGWVGVCFGSWWVDRRAAVK